jgi:alkylation response protein AidB-like acyl-CoA dehydrogenase
MADDDEALILEMVRDLVRERVAPRAAEIDASGEFPWDIQKLFAENDLLGIPLPVEYGGLGGSFQTYVKVVEEIAKACASSALIVAVQELGALPILIAGSEEQKQRFIPKLASGEWVAAYALTEAGSGSDAAGSMRVRAVRDGDDYVLDGTKIWITQGSIADITTVFAVTDPDKGANGISAFVLERGAPGFTVGKLEKKMGIRGSPTVELHFDGCRVPAANRLGADGEGFKIAMKVLDKSRPGIAAQALGIATGALEYATEYLKGRVAFGKPLAQQQGLQFMLADMKTEVEAARLLLYAAARKCDEGAPDITTWAAMAKLKCGDVAMSVTTDAVQLLGGFGYSSDYPVERMMRDAKITQIYEGTQQIQRIVIARSMVGRGK